MDFFGMGTGEILLILIVALIIWGPDKIPEITRTLGRTIRALRKATSDLATAMTKELDTDEKDHRSPPRVNRDDKTKEFSDAGKAESNDTEMTSPRDQ